MILVIAHNSQHAQMWIHYNGFHYRQYIWVYCAEQMYGYNGADTMVVKLDGYEALPFYAESVFTDWLTVLVNDGAYVCEAPPGLSCKSFREKWLELNG